MIDGEPLTPVFVMFAILAHAVQVVCQDLAIAGCQPIIRNHSSQGSDHFVQFGLIIPASQHLILKLVQLLLGSGDPVLIPACEGQGRT